jgi:hypothetical protein
MTQKSSKTDDKKGGDKKGRKKNKKMTVVKEVKINARREIRMEKRNPERKKMMGPHTTSGVVCITNEIFIFNSCAT